MFPLREIIFFLFIQVNTSYGAGWPANNYSKSAATYGIGALDDEVDWSQHPCKRECKDNEEPMTCRYGFTIENYVTMSRACYNCPHNLTDCYRPHCVVADGNPRTITVVNRRLPGPSIEVCEGDRIIVDVNNQMHGEPTTIHWHGLHQRGTPYMDGVPMISQCPIPAGDSFRYDFKVENTGTHLWHAHSGFHRADGVFGNLIVRQPASKNLVGHLYDHDEHVISLIDWNKMPSTDAYLLMHHRKPMHPHTILINGLGPYVDNSDANLFSLSSLIPRSVFQVKMGSRHRFRLINAGNVECSFSLTIDKHPLLVVSADGADVQPVEVDAIRLASGERYDFILNANREIANYWIRISSAGNCGSMRAHQEAILRYVGAADNEPDGPVGFNIGFKPDQRLLNPTDQGYETSGALCVSCSLTSIEPIDNATLAPTADYRFYLALDYYVLNDEFFRKGLYDTRQVSSASFMTQINHLSFKSPEFPLQTQSELIEARQFCNVAKAKCTRDKCSCEHAIQVKLNSSVELIFVNEAERKGLGLTNESIVHPMHLHGFQYQVLAMEKLGRSTNIEHVKAMDQAGKIHRKLKAAPRKDTLDIPSGGYAVVRFRADNPGYWFLHCHFETHIHDGMAMVLKVGEHKDFPPVPENLSKCPYHSDSPTSNTSTSSQSLPCNVLLALTALIYLPYLY